MDLFSALFSATVLFFSIGVLRLLHSIWWRPRMLERQLRGQGMRGPSYRFHKAYLKENSEMIKDSLSKPLGLTHDIVPRILPFLCKTIEVYGETSFAWYGTAPRVCIIDPELIREILSNRSGHFRKYKGNPLTNMLGGGGLGTLEGEKWVEHRRLLAPAFHLEKLKEMLPAFSGSCVELIERWESVIGMSESYELDVWSELKNLTGDVISRTAFGSSYEEGRKVIEIQSEQLRLHLKADRALYIPGFRFVPTTDNMRRWELIDRVREIFRGMIGKKEKELQRGDASSRDLLGVLLEAKRSSQNDQGERIKITTEDVINECKLFYFAGSDTTAALLTWTMVALSMHPIWQNSAREEVFKVFGKRIPDIDGLSQLKIVTMILYEVLRLYPPLPLFGRRTCGNVKVGNLWLPTGVQVCMPTVLVNRDPRFWGDDASEFNPQRFSDGVAKASSKGAFFPFGWGPRICIGQNFGLIEAKMALAMIVQRFWFELSPSYIHAPEVVVTLHPQHGAQIILHRVGSLSGSEQ